MFLNRFRSLPSTFRLIGGAVRSLTCGPTNSTSRLPTVALIPHFNPGFTEPSLIINSHSILDLPLVNKKILEIPTKIIPLEDKIRPTIVEEPDKVIEKQAARLVVIRRRKMKRHKLKKLRIRMKYAWAKVRQKREMAKEKAFQAELMCKVKEAENFNAQQYVREKLDKVNVVLLPKRWKGKSLPEFVIKDLLDEKNRKEERNREDLERRKKMNLRVSDYKF